MITLSIILLTIVPVALTLYVLLVEYPGVVLDETRQRLFEIRARLFQLGLNSDLGMESQAHVMLRDLLNGSIRFAHDLSALRLIAVRLTMRREPSRLSRRFRETFTAVQRSLHKETQEKLEQLFRDAENTMVRHVVLRSVVMSAAMTVYAIAATLILAVVACVRAPGVFARAVRRALPKINAHPIRSLFQSMLVRPASVKLARRIDGEALMYVKHPASALAREACVPA